MDPSTVWRKLTRAKKVPLLCLSLLHGQKSAAEDYMRNGLPENTVEDVHNDDYCSDPELTVSGGLIARTISSVLHYQCKLNVFLGITSIESAFDCKDNTRPSITIQKFVDRVIRYTGGAPEVYVLSMMYLDTLLERNPSMCLTWKNVHRLWFVSVMVAIKFLEDYNFTNITYSNIAGVPVAELNNLERLFLMNGISFSLCVSPWAFKQYKDCFTTQIPSLETDSNRRDDIVKRNCFEEAFRIHSAYFGILVSLGIGPEINPVSPPPLPN